MKTKHQRLSSFCLIRVAVLLAIAAAVTPVLAASTPIAPRPNFIFVLIDDMGYGDLSCYGDKQVQTPEIDRMAREGIRFTQFYVTSPICSPSRTGFTTGQCPTRWRITSYLDNRESNRNRGMAQWLDTNAPTLARTLKQAGYATGHFGKWHMGGQRNVGDAPLITEYGYDESLTQFEGLGDRILPLLDAYDGKPAKKYALGSDNLGRGNIQWMERSKVTGAFVNRALEFIKKQEAAHQPFYVNVWPDDVHSPFFPPKALRGNESKKELYLGVVKAMDEQLAPLFDYIRKSPELSTNTIILIASDNGPEPGAGTAGEFRGVKGQLFEGGTREPFIVWGPGFMGSKDQGKVNETTVVSALDLFPSVLTLARVQKPSVALDGEDLSQSWTGKTNQIRSRPLFWVRPPDRPGQAENVLPDLAMREGNWKFYCNYDGTGAQLYDLAHDPSETKNLASDNTKITKAMKTKLLDWYKPMPKDNGSKFKAKEVTTTPVGG